LSIKLKFSAKYMNSSAQINKLSQKPSLQIFTKI